MPDGVDSLGPARVVVVPRLRVESGSFIDLAKMTVFHRRRWRRANTLALAVVELLFHGLNLSLDSCWSLMAFSGGCPARCLDQADTIAALLF